MAKERDESIRGEAMVTSHLKERRVNQNPESAGKAEWDLRLWINGLERWATEPHLSVAQGEAVAIQASVPTKVAHFTNQLELKVRGIERDMNPDDHAYGEATLCRSRDFQRASGLPIDLKGRSAHVQLAVDVEEEPRFLFGKGGQWTDRVKNVCRSASAGSGPARSASPGATGAIRLRSSSRVVRMVAGALV